MTITPIGMFMRTGFPIESKMQQPQAPLRAQNQQLSSPIQSEKAKEITSIFDLYVHQYFISCCLCLRAPNNILFIFYF